MSFPTFNPMWATTFGIMGNIISLMVYLAPLPTFYRIWRKKSTEGFKSLPYLVAFFSSMLWLYYALLKQNMALLITINSFGCIVETIYIIIFLVYATRDIKKSTVRLIVTMTAMFLVAIFVTHYSVTTHSMQVKVFGWICVSVSVVVFLAPLSVAAQVIRTKSVEFMPFNLSLFLTLSAIMWFGYGFFRRDICVAIPNIIGFILGLSQMILYAIYRKSEKIVVIIPEAEKLPEHMRDVVMLGPVNNSAREVHPVVVDIILPIPIDESDNGGKELEQDDTPKNVTNKLNDLV